MAAIIVFDLNETPLDLSALDAFFTTVFSDANARVERFQTLEGIMLTSILLDENKKFSELSIAALQMTAEEKEYRAFPRKRKFGWLRDGFHRSTAESFKSRRKEPDVLR